MGMEPRLRRARRVQVRWQNVVVSLEDWAEALWATSRWKPTAIARRQSPRNGRVWPVGTTELPGRFFTSWNARVASGPHLPESSNARSMKLSLAGSTKGAYCSRLASSLSRAATPTDSYDLCLSTLVKHPSSVVGVSLRTTQLPDCWLQPTPAQYIHLLWANPMVYMRHRHKQVSLD